MQGRDCREGGLRRAGTRECCPADAWRPPDHCASAGTLGGRRQVCRWRSGILDKRQDRAIDAWRRRDGLQDAVAWPVKGRLPAQPVPPAHVGQPVLNHIGPYCGSWRLGRNMSSGMPQGEHASSAPTCWRSGSDSWKRLKARGEGAPKSFAGAATIPCAGIRLKAPGSGPSPSVSWSVANIW
jgi:hypothetical protein